MIFRTVDRPFYTSISLLRWPYGFLVLLLAEPVEVEEEEFVLEADPLVGLEEYAHVEVALHTMEQPQVKNITFIVNVSAKEGGSSPPCKLKNINRVPAKKSQKMLFFIHSAFHTLCFRNKITQILRILLQYVTQKGCGAAVCEQRDIYSYIYM